ncbi:hypothetical protein NS365_00320 [Aureimonas ureilytica]|uniref:FCP1 homology domain-containing protein n=1 Tax=Aureimonas ureilytica TaxID=401562 RepID=A0A147DB78_9HYPH|nr:hypothetical protein [Aureimonas ureilytica]KTR08430.1 hypothetical protein NS365_00320 [Aureimonas ureilytica]
MTTIGPSIDALPKRHDALLVLDVDEVVLHFIAPFCELLAEHGAQLHFESFRLTGNVRSLSTGAAVSGHELDRITDLLYTEQVERQRPVAGVAEALSELRESADIVFLTAMTPHYYAQRRTLLDQHGLTDPMIATERSKGGLLAEMRQRWKGPIVFVDDLPPNLEGARRSAPDIHLVHLMANREFRAHLPSMPKGTARADNWSEAAGLIQRLLAG